MSAYGIYGKNPLEFLDFSTNYQDPRGNHGAATSIFVKPLEVHFPYNRKHVEVDLGFVRSFPIKPVGDRSDVLDLLAFTSDSILLSLENQTNHVRVLKMVDLEGNVKKTDKEEESVKRMAVLEVERSMAQTDGQKVVITTRKLDGTSSSFSMDFERQSAVQAIASVNQRTLAVALDKRVTLLTSEGIVSNTYDRRCGSNCLGTWTYPVVDMCGLTDDNLLLFDQCGIHQINPYNGNSYLIEGRGT